MKVQYHKPPMIGEANALGDIRRQVTKAAHQGTGNGHAPLTAARKRENGKTSNDKSSSIDIY
jgi:hypothetical protein